MVPRKSEFFSDVLWSLEVFTWGMRGSEILQILMRYFQTFLSVVRNSEAF